MARAHKPKVLKLPTPWGNQPDRPPDSPLSMLIEANLGHGFCFPGFLGYHPPRKPPCDCDLGSRSECAWGLQLYGSRFCVWYFLAKNPGENSVAVVAEALGLSTERIRHYLRQGLESFEEKYAGFGYQEGDRD